MKMVEIPAARFATFDGVDGKRPAMSVGRGEDRGFQIRAEIVQSSAGLCLA
jgi:hypothetical protein